MKITTTTFGKSWNNNNQTKTSDVRTIRSLSEREGMGRHKPNKTTMKTGNSQNADNGENYDESRYDALTQDYYDMMEDDITNGRGSSVSLLEMINNIDPKAQFTYCLDKLFTEDNDGEYDNYSNAPKKRSLGNFFKNINKRVENEMVSLINSGMQDNGYNTNGKKNKARNLKSFLKKYKLLSAVGILGILGLFFSFASQYTNLGYGILVIFAISVAFVLF
ncbi:Plasmodium exported protein, unknown function, partial [Plasmodium malariae]